MATIRFPRSAAGQPPSAFSLENGVDATNSVNLLVLPHGSHMAPGVIWSREFDTAEDRQAFVAEATSGRCNLAFLGRLTMIFGGAELDSLSDRLVTEAQDARRRAEERAAELASKHLVVNLYAPDAKGSHRLELCRASRSVADWSVIYGRAAERDRLCDCCAGRSRAFLSSSTMPLHMATRP